MPQFPPRGPGRASPDVAGRRAGWPPGGASAGSGAPGPRGGRGAEGGGAARSHPDRPARRRRGEVTAARLGHQWPCAEGTPRAESRSVRGRAPAGWRGGGHGRLRSAQGLRLCSGSRSAALRGTRGLGGRPSLSSRTTEGLRGSPAALGAVLGRGRGNEVPSRDAVTAPPCLWL